MSKVETYYRALVEQADPDSYLLMHSGLPGPRANLELLQAAIEAGDCSTFERYLALDEEAAIPNTPTEFLVVIGVAGLGKLVAQNEPGWLPTLRQKAADPRWRVREAVAIGLQTWGDADLPALLAEMRLWAKGSPYEQRAAVAALCEPRLLVTPLAARQVLEILDEITASLLERPDRKSAPVRVLRQGLAYGWSVAVAACPDIGKPLMEKWLANPDPDVAWLMGENLKKARLERMDREWVGKMRKEHP